MSRSRKKNPVVTQTNCKLAKKDANRKIRNTEDIGSGNNYKKHYNSWNICDYKFWVKRLEGIWESPKWFRK